ncbi:response regulator transcription factor [Streptomyces sp. NPDC087769]|uniref:response regulator transcription factor n=1 Tax=Streptomyces sp. NPDC087769 TaxID=3365802 RepID=UPI00382197A4
MINRERDVVQLVLRGKSTVQFAECLVVTSHTVQQHLESIFAKTEVRSRRDLVGNLLSGQSWDLRPETMRGPRGCAGRDSAPPPLPAHPRMTLFAEPEVGAEHFVVNGRGAESVGE